MEEHRISPRQRILKAGTISFNGAGISCTVRNLSSTGAALEVASPFGIPDHFTLVFEGDHSVKPCHIVWRKEKRIGVAFD
jgi:PilZ domain-containing protein